MSRHSGWSSLFSLAVCLVVACLATASEGAQDAQLEVHFIDVGQGDAILVRCPDNSRHLVIDSGELNSNYPKSADQFQAYLTKEFANRPRRVDVVVASHPHSDHIASLEWLLQNFTVGTYIDNGQKYDTATWTRLDKLVRQRVKQGQLEYINGRKPEFTEVEFCPDVKLEVMAAAALKSLSDTNDRSVFVRLAYRNNSFLFVGDAHKAAEDVLLSKLSDEQLAKLDVDVLKVGHHGSKTSSGGAFVGALSPTVAVISSGKKEVGSNARFKHPRWVTVQTFLNHFKQLDAADHHHPANDRIWVFDEDWSQRQRRRGLCVIAKDGTVVIKSDGSRIEVSAAGCRPQ
jgi:competence protein ComEC